MGVPFWFHSPSPLSVPPSYLLLPCRYVVKLIGSKEKLKAKIEQLERDGWMDERTRAVFVEFSLYNAQVNLFAACRIVMEQGPEGKGHGGTGNHLLNVWLMVHLFIKYK